MKIINSYRYVGENGTVDTTVLLPMEHEERRRLIADEGMALTDGENIATVIDIPITDVDKWSEIVEPIVTEEGEAV